MRFSKSEWAILIGICCVLTCVISGCFGARGRTDPIPHHDTLTGIPDLIQRIALVFAGMATVAIFLASIAAWFTKNPLILAKYAAVAFGVLISAGLLYWLAEHWAWAIGLSTAALLAGIAGYAYLHKKDIRKQFCKALNTPSK